MFELIAGNFLQRFEKLDSRSRFQILGKKKEKKDWKLSPEMNSKEYISDFPLIFQFPLNVLCNFCQLSEYLYFYKTKTYKISCSY